MGRRVADLDGPRGGTAAVHDGTCADASVRPAGRAGGALSRFAVLRAENREVVLESPLGWARFRLCDPSLWGLIWELSTGASHSRRAVEAGTPARTMLEDLSRSGLTDQGEDGPSTKQWSSHELMFHWKTRLGERALVGQGFGGTRWGAALREELEAAPGVPRVARVVDLWRPDLGRLAANDVSLTEALERRRSIRRYDDSAPVTVQELGEFLYRCARARSDSSRPYPAGGAAYELEIYPVVRRVAGLAAGLYRYDPLGHRLEHLEVAMESVRSLLADSRRSTFENEPPQVLLIVSARFERLMLTYEQIGYSLIEKHVGVLYQSMYLVATAMELGGCAIGTGYDRAFNEATGVDYVVESAVGEFMLGRGRSD
ncbi:SagB/ThcOx family dehydrogenase [[Actinomadura] parvosata]|uniref:SagB/ThcOx family dehydrogenase n=1 Tax=[Actinomadura] parvosata TaxID=1955412 RepID=UPI00406D49CC